MQYFYKFWMLGIWLFATSLPVLADTNASSGMVPFGNVFHIKGEVSAQSKSGVIRNLKQADTLYVGDRIVSGPTGEAVLKTRDSGIVAVRPNSELVMDAYAAEGKSSDHQLLKLMTGSLRVISGWIGQVNREQHRIITPGATIGIRGTDHEPFVLPAQAIDAKFSQGTYDKVNRGQTVLDANGASVDISKGLVGYARDPAAPRKRQRAMMTILMPVLLEVVPDFYVGGSFDDVLDTYSTQADAVSKLALDAIRNSDARTHDQSLLVSAASEALAPLPLLPQEKLSLAPRATVAVEDAACPAQAIGLAWLASLDNAIAQRDANAILALFSTDVKVKATVLSGGKPSTFSFTRDEMVQSTLKSIASLKEYQQYRENNTATLAQGVSSADCNSLRVQSDATEQGLMHGRTFRFKASEVYSLQKENGHWQAIAVHTTQH
jgi:hypothetical protein